MCVCAEQMHRLAFFRPSHLLFSALLGVLTTTLGACEATPAVGGSEKFNRELTFVFTHFFGVVTPPGREGLDTKATYAIRSTAMDDGVLRRLLQAATGHDNAPAEVELDPPIQVSLPSDTSGASAFAEIARPPASHDLMGVDYNLGGTSDWVENVSVALAELGHRVYVLTRAYGAETTVTPIPVPGRATGHLTFVRLAVDDDCGLGGNESTTAAHRKPWNKYRAIECSGGHDPGTDALGDAANAWLAGAQLPKVDVVVGNHVSGSMVAKTLALGPALAQQSPPPKLWMVPHSIHSGKAKPAHVTEAMHQMRVAAETMAYSKGGTVFVLSDNDQELVRRQFNRDAKIFEIPAGAASHFLKPPSMASHPDMMASVARLPDRIRREPFFLSWGRPVERKGYRYMFASLARLHQGKKILSFAAYVSVGNSSTSNYTALEDRLRQDLAGANVQRFAGVYDLGPMATFPFSDGANYYMGPGLSNQVLRDTASLGVVAVTGRTEAFGIIPINALAAGRPVILSNFVGASRRVIEAKGSKGAVYFGKENDLIFGLSEGNEALWSKGKFIGEAQRTALQEAGAIPANHADYADKLTVVDAEAYLRSEVLPEDVRERAFILVNPLDNTSIDAGFYFAGNQRNQDLLAQIGRNAAATISAIKFSWQGVAENVVDLATRESASP